MIKDIITSIAEWWITNKTRQDELDLIQMNAERSRELRKSYFNNMLLFAESVLSESERLKESNRLIYNEHPMIDVIRLLGRKVHTDYYIHLLNGIDYSNLKDLSIHDYFFDISVRLTDDGKKFHDIIEQINTERIINLRKDIVLSWPWRRDRLSDCLSRIGEGRIDGRWQQDSNHNVTLLLPIGIAFVSGGNHSLMTGIVQGEGVLRPTTVYDISPLYKYVKCDGDKFYSVKNGAALFAVKSVELAAIFEIGRIMAESKICF